MEMTKRLDPALPYFYHTSSHDRFYKSEQPSFDNPGKSTRNPRKQCPRQIELLSGMASGRAMLPVPGSRCIRMQFHNLLVALPPPPGIAPHGADHTLLYTVMHGCFVLLAFAPDLYMQLQGS